MAYREFEPFHPPRRILLGPGPSMIDPRVYQAMAAPVVGYKDDTFFELLDDVQHLLRYVFETENEFTMVVSGTGSAGMEAAVVNFIEPGTKVLQFANGFFSERIGEMCRRQRAEIVRFEKPWGEVAHDAEAVECVEREKPDIVIVIHGETSTGALQPVKAICDAAHAAGALVIGDCVASLAGTPVEVDKNGIDIAYSGSQKCISAPPGLAPLTLSPRALERLRARKTDCVAWYLDLRLIGMYWGDTHRYHHTPPINMYYAIREALRLVHEEGLQARFARHRLNHMALVAGIEAIGLRMHVAAAHRLWTLNTPLIPAGIDEVTLRAGLLRDYGIEVLGGLGVLEGKILRVGLMGASSTRNNVLLFLEGLETCLKRAGYGDVGGAVRAAEDVYAEHER